MDTTQLIHRLQLLQSRLYEMADHLGNLTDPKIVAVSEEADRLIVQLQLLQRKEAQQRKKTASSASIPLDAQCAKEIGQESRALFLEHS